MHPLRYSTYSYFAVQNGVCETLASPGAGRKDQSLVSAAGQVAGCSTYVFACSPVQEVVEKRQVQACHSNDRVTCLVSPAPAQLAGDMDGQERRSSVYACRRT